MFTSIKVGIYLAIKDLARASKLTTLLIVFIMTLTFLNLTVGRGILVGLPKGATNVYDERYSGDLIISKLRKDQFIVNDNEIEKFYSNLSGIKYISKRFLHPATLTAGYDQRLRDTEVYDSTGTVVVGLDFANEDKVTGLSRFVVEGKYPENTDTNGILIGANLLFRYSPLDSPTESNIKNLKIGDKVKLTVNGVDHFYFVRGVVKSKVSEVDRRVYLPFSEFKIVSGERDFKPEEISFKLESGVLASTLKSQFYAQGLHKLAKIQTAEESQPQFLIF